MNIQFWIDHSGSLFHQLFMIVMGGLTGISNILGTTYNVINIFTYYVFVPSTWIYLISRKTSIWVNSISGILIIAFLCLPDIKANCDYFFQKSVDFLNYTAGIFGSNYIDMSVYICVVVIGLVYLVLVPLTLPKTVSKKLFIASTVTFALYMLIIYPNFKDLLLFTIEKMNIEI